MKNIKRVATMALSVALAASVVAVSPVDAAKSATLKITAPTTKKSFTQAAKTKKLKFTVKNGTVKSVAVTSNKKTVVKVSKVSKSGATLTTAGKNGTAKVTVKVTLTTGKTVKKTLKVTVKNKATKMTVASAVAYKYNGYYIIPKTATKKFTVTFKAKGTTKIGNKAVTVKASNKKYATATYKKTSVKNQATLTVKGSKAGKVTFTLTAKDGSGKSVKIPVRVVAKKSAITAADVAVEAGKAAQIDAKATGGTVNAIQSYAVTAGADFATVDKNGKVTGIKAGTATVKITAVDGSTKDVTVTVTGSPVAFKADTKAELTVSSANASTLLDKFEKAAKADPAEFAAIGEVKVTVDKVDYTAKVDDKGVVAYTKAGKAVAAADVKKKADAAKTSKGSKVATIVVPATADKIPALLAKLQAGTAVAGDTSLSATLKSSDNKVSVTYDKVSVAADYITLTSGKTTAKLYVVDGQLYATSADEVKGLVDAGILEVK